MNDKQLEEIILKKIAKKEQLTAKDVEMLIYKDGFNIETVVIDKYRWTELVNTIIELDGKYYRIYWEQALTECQDDIFESQLAIEVEKKKKIIETYEWVEIKGE